VICFLDSSALVKRYADEPGADLVRSLSPCVVSAIARVEVPAALWRKHRDAGFTVLGFPCDQFGHQEPGDAAEIKAFCSSSYDVTFPLFAKIDVNGAHAHPLYVWLKGEKAGIFGTEAIKWNFTKFLVDAAGEVVQRYAPADSPEKIDKDVGNLLSQRRD